MIESSYEMVQRRGREGAARLRLHVAEIERHRAAGTLVPCPVSIPLAVGTFDCNGVAKGSGW